MFVEESLFRLRKIKNLLRSIPIIVLIRFILMGPKGLFAGDNFGLIRVTSITFIDASLCLLSITRIHSFISSLSSTRITPTFTYQFVGVLPTFDFRTMIREFIAFTSF